jgi:hypothetical protein
VWVAPHLEPTSPAVYAAIIEQTVGCWKSVGGAASQRLAILFDRERPVPVIVLTTIEFPNRPFASCVRTIAGRLETADLIYLVWLLAGTERVTRFVGVANAGALSQLRKRRLRLVVTLPASQLSTGRIVQGQGGSAGSCDLQSGQSRSMQCRAIALEVRTEYGNTHRWNPLTRCGRKCESADEKQCTHPQAISLNAYVVLHTKPPSIPMRHPALTLARIRGC